MIVSPTAIQAALTELQQKSDEQIETETAIKWAARALAAWQLATTTGMSLKWLTLAVCFKSEAIEHGAFGTAGTLAAIQQQLEIVP